jgi:hypothetical protein
MFYIFHGSDFEITREKALLKAQALSKKIFFLNEETVEFKKEAIENFLYYFLLPTNELAILIVEHPENINNLTLQTYLQLLESLPENHSIIFITSTLHLLPKTIISRALVFDCITEDHDKSEKEREFVENFSNQVIEDLPEFLDRHGITELNTKEKTIPFLKKFSNKREEISKIMNSYHEFIKKSHNNYWKCLYMIIKN